MPEFHVLAGPNGSGKSTFTRQVDSGLRRIDYAIPPVINPDLIAQHLSPHDPDAAAGPAAREALRLRGEAFAKRESFAIETTLSGNSELLLIEVAHAAGYLVTMTYIALSNADLSVYRVALRAREESRTVPAADVRRRYKRSLDNLSRVVAQIDVIHVVDNSGDDFWDVARLERGRVVTVAKPIPLWAERALAPQLALARDRTAIADHAVERLRSVPSSRPRAQFVERALGENETFAGMVIAATERHIAISVSPQSFFIVERAKLDRAVEPGQSVRVELSGERCTVQIVEGGASF
ncbi:MAG: zeta toxin family protein [Vulcanimicrobiaceae bacterium]